MDIFHLILQYGTDTSIILRVFSCLVLAFFCIPLQVRQAGVKNGLRILRFQLLGVGVAIFITNLVSIYFLFDAKSRPQNLVNIILQIFNALMWLVISLIGHAIYHTQYSEESISLHEKVAQKEKRLKKS